MHPTARLLWQRVEAAAASDPGRRAHVWPAGSLTYAALRARALALAEELPGPAHSPVVLWGHKEGAMLVAMLACARVGRPYVPADTALPAARIAWMADLVGAGACIAAQPLPTDLATHLRLRGVPVVALEPDGRRAPGPSPWSGEATPAPAGGTTLPATAAHLAYVMFTSGTTGRPKGVPITWEGLGHFVGWLLAEQRPRWADEVVLNQAPFSFDLSVLDTYFSLLSAGTLFSITRDLIAAPAQLFAWLGDSGLTTWVSTPSFARFCCVEPRFGAGLLPRLRRLLFCGETLSPALVRELMRRFPGARVWNTYGPTETTVAVASVPIDAAPDDDTPLPVGRPAPGLRVWVAGEDLEPLPDGEVGEIVVAGPQVSPGYLLSADMAEAAAAFVPPGPEPGRPRAYRTGDLGRLQGGLLYWEGRRDRQVKLHGYRLELDEIEAGLRRLPGVADAAVVAVRRQGVADHLVAFVVPRPEAGGGEAVPPQHVAPEGPGTGDSGAAGAPDGGGPTPRTAPVSPPAFARAQALRRALAQQLPPYALPRVIHFVAALPLTANGKVDLQALAARGDAGP
jgi:D-alanine--poly(phosphoribitol) ligase subunit 1